MRPNHKVGKMKHAFILIALFLVGSAHAAICATAAITPDMYGGNANCWQMKRHAEKMNVVTNGGARVVFLGDSITHNWEVKGKGLDVFREIQKKYDVLNIGYSSDCTEHVLWRITDGGELDGYSAELVMLMIGTNNTGHRTAEEEPPHVTAFAIKEILKVVRSKQPKAKIVLLPIFPRGASAEDPKRVRNEKVNAEIKNFADGKDVFWVDFNAKLVDEKGDTKFCMPDRLHPNTAVYRNIWLPAIKPYLERCGK